jgi:hypothetical protein
VSIKFISVTSFKKRKVESKSKNKKTKKVFLELKGADRRFDGKMLVLIEPVLRLAQFTLLFCFSLTLTSIFGFTLV